MPILLKEDGTIEFASQLNFDLKLLKLESCFFSDESERFVHARVCAARLCAMHAPAKYMDSYAAALIPFCNHEPTKTRPTYAYRELLLQLGVYCSLKMKRRVYNVIFSGMNFDQAMRASEKLLGRRLQSRELMKFMGSVPIGSASELGHEVRQIMNYAREKQVGARAEAMLDEAHKRRRVMWGLQSE